VKTTIYTIEDDALGITLTVEAELCDFEDGDPPEIVINDISHGDKCINHWPLSERYFSHLKNRVFQGWCLEGMKHHA
jgi:hypothetical protein